MAKGVDWKTVQASSLNEGNQKLYKHYHAKVAEASELAQTLKAAAQKQWDEKHPKGVDGKVAFFNAINGVLLYAMKDKPSGSGTVKKAFDTDKGDDPFA